MALVDRFGNTVKSRSGASINSSSTSKKNNNNSAASRAAAAKRLITQADAKAKTTAAAKTSNTAASRAAAAKRLITQADAKAKTTARRPATVTKPTAVTTQFASPNIVSSSKTPIKSAWQINADKVWNDSVKATAASANSGSSDAAIEKESKRLLKNSAEITTHINKTAATKPNIMDQLNGNSNRSILFDPTSRDKFVNNGKAKAPVDEIYSKSTSTDPNDGKNLSYNNETVATKDKYNQAYWAKQLASGKSQTEIKAMQDAAGSKVYSGAEVVSKDNKRTALDTLKRVTGSDATIQNGGVTRDWERSGLLGENVKGTFKWNDGTTVTTMANNPVVGGKFNEVTGRIDGGTRLGDYNSTTFSGTGNYTGATAGSNDTVKGGSSTNGSSSTGSQVAVASVKGGNDGLGTDAKTVIIDAAASTTLADVLDKTVNIDTLTVDALTTTIAAVTTVAEADKLIKTTTDPKILKSLHKRRLSLMRGNRTRTRFAGLLDDEDTKRTNLMSIG
jgi:hypothetical protein